MTIFIILMIIVWLMNGQEKKITLEDIQRQRQEYLKNHQDSMRYYDYLYQLRQERHNKWLEMMKRMERLPEEKS